VLKEAREAVEFAAENLQHAFEDARAHSTGFYSYVR
jgi:hypothetical protein